MRHKLHLAWDDVDDAVAYVIELRVKSVDKDGNAGPFGEPIRTLVPKKGKLLPAKLVAKLRGRKR